MDKFIHIGEKFGLEGDQKAARVCRKATTFRRRKGRDGEYLKKTEEGKKKRKRKGVEEKTKKGKLGGKNAK